MTIAGQNLLFMSFPVSDSLIRGKRNAFSVESCFDDVSGPVCYPMNPSSAGSAFADDVGAISQQFSATQGTNDQGVLVDWEAPATLVQRYQIERCDANSRFDCRVYELEGTATNFLDTDVQRGRVYDYTLSVCDSLFSNSDNADDPRNGRCEDDDAFIYQFGEALTGFVSLVDDFEDDDVPSQATPVRGDVLQLHSFDSPTDEDWVRITLDAPSRIAIETLAFTGEVVDTTLALYDATLTLIGENDDKNRLEAPGSFSKIETDTLDTGIYFVKTTNFKLPSEENLLAPTANNYLLSIEILDGDVIPTPAIQLLLLDES